MNDVNGLQAELHNKATRVLHQSMLLPLLSRLGKPTVTGSYTTQLMAYPDLDFSIQTTAASVDDAYSLIDDLRTQLGATSIGIVDFANNPNESAMYYVRIVFPYMDESWNIDATISQPGPIIPNPPELTDWLAAINDEQRSTILELKQQLITAGRYVGAKSTPPYTFRSVHLYEAVLVGGAKTIADLESYFTHATP